MERDIDKAKQWLEKAKAGGLTAAEKELERLEKLDYIEAILSLLDSSTVCALKAFEAGEWCEGFKLAQNAYRDNKKIQFYLGVCYHKGYGCKSNKAEAFKWYLKSAKQGLASAQLNVGIAYFEGWGGERNIDNAIVWLSKARENGDPVVHDDAIKVFYDNNKRKDKGYDKDDCNCGSVDGGVCCKCAVHTYSAGA